MGAADKYEFRYREKCGSSVELKAFYVDENEYSEPAQVTWHSTDEANVTVSQGIARALRTGYARIIATDADGNTACCDIAVIDNYNRTTVQNIRLNADSLLLSQGESFQLAAEFFPKDYFDNGALNTKLIWSSDNEDAAVVDQNGVIRALREGTVTITAESADVGRTAECRVRIENADGQTAEEAIDYTGLSSVGNAYLYNLHICKETVTADSVNLLWNRLSLIDLEKAFHYEVRFQKKDAGEEYRQRRTVMLGLTIDGLEPSTEYEFMVRAVSEAGEELTAGTVSARTAEKAAVCLNVCDEPYCAAGDGITLDTRAVQRAINECPVGGTVYLPAHKVFLTGSVLTISGL